MKKDYPKVPIGNFAKVKGGKRLPKGKLVQDDKTSHPYIRVTDFHGGILDKEKVKYIDEETHQKVKRYIITDDDVFISIAGTIGLVGIIPSSFSGANLTENAAKICELSPTVDKRYLALYLQSHLGQAEIAGRIVGTSQPKLALFRIEEIEIPVPPLPTQRRIAEILSAYDDLIEVNTRRIRILERMAQSVYRETVQAPSVPASLPEGWTIKELGDIAKEVRRSVQPSEIDPETPYFGLEHLPRKSLALSDWGKASDVQSTKLAFKKGEILFGKIRPYFHKVGIAPLDGVASSDTIIIVPKSPEYFGLVLSCVFSEEFVNQATLTSQGTKMPRANWDVLVKYPIALPPKPILEKFNQTNQDIVDLLTVLLFKNRNLRRTRDLLLPRLVGGEVGFSPSW